MPKPLVHAVVPITKLNMKVILLGAKTFSYFLQLRKEQRVAQLEGPEGGLALEIVLRLQTPSEAAVSSASTELHP